MTLFILLLSLCNIHVLDSLQITMLLTGLIQAQISCWDKLVVNKRLQNLIYNVGAAD